MKKNVKYVLKNMISLSLASFSGMFFLFIANLFILKSLSKTDYGKYRFFISLIVFFQFFSLKALDKVILKKLTQGYFGYLKKAFFEKMKYSLVVVVLSFVLAVISNYYGYLDYSVFFIYLAVFFIFYSTFDFYNVYFTALKRFDIISIIQFSKAFIMFVAVIFVYFSSFSKNWYLFLILYFFSYSLINAFAGFKVLISLKNVKPSGDDSIINEGKKLSFLNFIFALTDNIDVWVLKYVAGFQTIALYSAAKILETPFKTLNKNLNSVLFPVFSSYPSLKKAWSSLKKKFMALFFINVLLAGFMYFIIPLFYVYFIPKYVDAVEYARVIIIAVIVLGFFKELPEKMFLADEKFKSAFNINFVIPVFRITSTIILGYKYGLWGVIYARVISFIFAPLYSYFIMKIGEKHEK
jgi:O-antigen/teichoic acid export membrane protein